MTDECPLLDSCTGRIVTPVADRLVDEHFNCLLDAIGQWKRTTKSIDLSLMGNFFILYKKIKFIFV